MSKLKALGGLLAALGFFTGLLAIFAFKILFVLTVIYFFLAAVGIVPPVNYIPIIPFV